MMYDMKNEVNTNEKMEYVQMNVRLTDIKHTY